MDLLGILREHIDLYNDLMKTKETIKPVLENRIHLDFTSHGIDHSERIVEKLTTLLEDLMNSPARLNKYELFILLAAIYLHDVGMQYDKLDILNNHKEKLQYNDIPGDQQKLNYIRENHNVISEIWIMENIKGNTEFRKIYYGDKTLGGYVALIVKSHNIDIINNMSDYQTITFATDQIRLSLIAAILSLGDAIDIDFRRVDIERFKHIEVSSKSRLHWWKHYYVNGIRYNNGLMEINYCFPQFTDIMENKVYIEYFTKEIEYWIYRIKEQLKEILLPNHINYEINRHVSYSAGKEKLSNEDYEYIFNQVLSEEIALEEKLRQILAKIYGYKNIRVYREESNLFVRYDIGKVKIIKVDYKEMTDEYEKTLSDVIKILNEWNGEHDILH